MTEQDMRFKVGLFLELYERQVKGQPGWSKEETVNQIMTAIERYEKRSRFDPSKYASPS